MNKAFKSILSMFLAVCMTVSVLPSVTAQEDLDLSDVNETTEEAETAVIMAGESLTAGVLTYKISGDEATIISSQWWKSFSDSELEAAFAEIEAAGFTITSIGNQALSGCNSLTDVTIPAGVTYIGIGAFQDCISLNRITIPESVEIIDEMAFWGCTSLISVIIPDSVVGISGTAFAHCTSLINVNIGSGVSSIGLSAFGGCTSLTNIIVDAENSTFESIDGVLFSDDNESYYNKKTLVCYPEGKRNSDYIIPNGVVSIGMYAFQNHKYLTNLTIPDSLTHIYRGAFINSTSLTSITIPESVTSIESTIMFSDCPFLTIYGVTGSYAENYAYTNNIPFKSLNDDENSRGFNFKTDTFNFVNYHDYFIGDGDNNGLFHDYDIRDDYYSILLAGNDIIHGARICWQKINGWAGSCFGMSAVAALISAGEIDMPGTLSSVKNTRDMANPNTDLQVESLINYYHLLQHSKTTKTAIEANKSLSDAEVNKKIVDNVTSSQFPVIIGFECSIGKHAVAAYDIISNSSGHLITIYDPNFNNAAITLIISSDYSQATFSYSGYNTNLRLLFAFRVEDGKFNTPDLQSALAVNGTSSFNMPLFMSESNAVQVAFLETNYDNFTIGLYNADNSLQSSALVTNGEAIGDLEIFGTAENGIGFELRKTWIVPDTVSGQYYRIAPTGNELSIVTGTPITEYETSMISDSNEFFSAVTAGDSGVIIIKDSGEISTDFTTPAAQKISVTTNSMTTPWQAVSYEGESTGLDVTPTTTGASVKSADNAVVQAYASNAFSELNFDNVVTDNTGNVGLTTSESSSRTAAITGQAVPLPEQEFKMSVIFMVQGGSEVATINVTSGETITKPADPTRNGYAFTDWFTDASFTTVYDFNTPVTSDLVLYSGWSKTQTTLYGDANGDGVVGNMDVTLLKQSLAGWKVTIFDGADANGDNTLSN
ncbi:MAG: leucine-rich repeat protein, partial [Ruminococcus sp.]|nr:leucine-rich repeat protein [Ruminococcus sp.]